MNVYQSFLKVSFLSLVLLSNAISFGMIIKYNNEKNRKIFEASAATFWTRCYDNEKKEFEKLTLEEQGRRNLEKLYRNQDPKFVSNFLLTHNVPVLLIDLASPFHSNNSFEDENKEGMICGITPYDASFYSTPDNHCFNEEIIALGNKRLRAALKQKSAQQNCFDSLGCYRWKSFGLADYGDNANYPLTSSALFGSNEDVERELNDIHVYDKDAYDILFCAILSFIHYPNKKNNALELLLSHLKQGTDSARCIISEFGRGITSYKLLCSAVEDREVFELICNKDPYKTNMLSWKHQSENESQTNLERIMKNANFDKEHVQTLIDNGGMTTQDIVQMKIVDRILKKQMTLEEALQRDRCERLAVDIPFGKRHWREPVRLPVALQRALNMLPDTARRLVTSELIDEIVWLLQLDNDPSPEINENNFDVD